MLGDSAGAVPSGTGGFSGTRPAEAANTSELSSNAPHAATPAVLRWGYCLPVIFRNIWFSWQTNSIISEPSATTVCSTLTVNGRV